MFSPSFLQKLPHLVFPSSRISSRSFADLFGGGGGISITQIYLLTFVRQTRSAVMRAGLSAAHPSFKVPTRSRWSMRFFSKLWADDQGQDMAEYAVMFAAILVVVIGTLRLVGSNTNNAFSAVVSSLQ